MEEKRVVVTGGASGIGKAIALAFAQKGALVFILDKEEALFQKWSEKAENIVFIQTDVKEERDIKAAFATIASQSGPVDILINNAGVSTFTPLFELSVEEWDNVLNTNLRSVFLASKEAALHMQPTGKPASIINISSTRARMSESNSEAYAASKGGVEALTHALALSLAEKNIAVNAIAPGWIHTTNDALREIDHEQHPSKRVGTPEDIANACLFLADERNRFINGETIVIDGGMTRKMMYEQ
ncbi:SDR family oxidoreductase [Bacillus sp. FSL W7-1321]